MEVREEEAEGLHFDELWERKMKKNIMVIVKSREGGKKKKEEQNDEKADTKTSQTDIFN